MNLTTDRPATASEDHIAQVLEQYLADQRAGRAPTRQQLREQYPDLAHDLDECLETLEYLEGWELGPESPPGAAPLTRDQLLSRTLGDFRIIRELGRGGMGIVYEAEQLSLSRRVALKILPFAAVLDPRHLQRFKNEAIAAAQLAHPHIVDVHGVGCERGVHFYAMRLIEGQTLAAVIDALRLADAGTASLAVAGTPSLAVGGTPSLAVGGTPTMECGDSSPLSFSSDDASRANATVIEIQSDDKSSHSKDTVIAALSTLRTTKPRDFYRRVAELGIQAAEALDHAHQMGIIHRDIKPSNLMLECSPLDRSHLAPRDEASLNPERSLPGVHPPWRAAGTLNPVKLWITDFGLARIQADASMTLTGDLLGTLRYMSPEQAAGKSAILDHRTDIYSLGVTLYELLTLRPAFPADDRQTLLRQIANDEPTAPRKLNAAVPAELETILLKAIAKDPAERYVTAGELADDLGRFRDHKAIKAKPPTVWQRVNRLARRHPAVPVSTMCVLLVALLATLAAYRISSREQSRTAAALQEKNAALQQAEENFDFAQDAVDGMYTRLAMQWIADNAAPTRLQQDFLKQAAAFYQRIVREIPPSGDQLYRVAVAFQRLGAIQYYLKQYAAAAESLEHALRLSEELAASEPRSRVVKDLPSMYRLRAVILLKLGDRDAAREAVEAGQRRLEQLIGQDPAVLELRFEQVEFDHIQSHLLASGRQFSAAAACLGRARQRLAELRQQPRPDLHLRIDTNLVENHEDLAKIHLTEGRLSAAREEFQQGLRVFNRARQFGYTDFRPLAELQISLTEGLGEVAEQDGDYDQAVERYNDVLRLRRDLLPGGREPSQFIVAVFKRQTNLDAQMEHGPFCAYIETQLRLSRALRQLGRSYEAEYRLGQSMLAMYVIAAERPSVLRYHVAEANIWALTWKLLEEVRPSEAEPARDKALVIWRKAMARFPHAAVYESGVHGAQSDLEWFRSLLDDTSAALLTSEALPPSPMAADGFPDIAFRHHATARSFYDGEIYESAIKWFEKSVDLRDVDHTYPWLHIAMAQAKLGRREAAREWFDRAIAAIDATDDADGELVELRGEAEALLNGVSLTHSTNASSFIGLGDLPGGQFDSGLGSGGTDRPLISRDGSVVVGTGTSDQERREAFRWTLDSGMVGLGRLLPPGIPFPESPIGPFNSTARGVSANGNVVVGFSVSERTDHQEAYRWTQDTGMVALGFLDGFKPRISRSHPLDVSDDGSIMVGVNNTYPTSFIPSRTGAFRWTETDGMVNLGGPPEFTSWPTHEARLVSGDGAVIVGASSSGGNFSQKQRALWRWTERAGFSVLDQSRSGVWGLSATDITPDGAVIVGWRETSARPPGDNRFRWRPFRWTEESGVVDLDGWDLDTFGSVVNAAVTDDGATIVGSPGAFNYYPANAVPPSFIWDEQHGMRNLSTVLASEHGLAVQMEGWTALRATDISGDGRRIVGTGVNPQGLNEAWIAILEARLPAGDFNGNGLVEQADLNLVLEKWGQPASAVVPWINDLPTGAVERRTPPPRYRRESAGATGRGGAILGTER
ncbi:MAG: protein kinase [Pirellulales bacterium]